MSKGKSTISIEKQREYSRKSYWKNHEKALELARQRSAKYREENREKFNKSQREYNLRNKDHINEKRRERLKNDPDHAEKIRAKDRERYAVNAAKHRSSRLKSVYRITLEDYLKMYSEQDGKCWICKEPKPPKGKDGLVVDHCHAKGNVRGLLCYKCNHGLGKFNDSIQNLQRAIEYLSN